MTIHREINRNIGIDLLRIVAMLMIVVLHLVCHTFDDGASGGSASTIFTHHLLRAHVLVCVEVYGMISGYVMIYSTPKYSHLFELWLQIMFYALGISLLVYFSGLPMQSMLKQNLRPITNSCYWYLSAYFGMYILLPLLNPGLQSIKMGSLYYILIVIMFLYSILSLLNGEIFGLGYGYTTLWLLICYIYGAAIRRIKEESSLVLSKKAIGVIFAILWGAFVIYALIEAVFPELVTTNVGVVAERLFREYTSPLMIIYAGVLVYVFSDFQICHEKTKKVIQWGTPLTLGVYLIHCHRVIWYNFMLMCEIL